MKFFIRNKRQHLNGIAAIVGGVMSTLLGFTFPSVIFFFIVVGTVLCCDELTKRLF